MIGAAPPRAAASAPARPGAACHVESRRLSACGEIAASWSALARRAVTANPFFEPGFLLPAAQHLVAFREVSVLLVWQDGAGAQERRLVGFMPYRRKARMLRPESVTGCEDARLLCDWPLIDREGALPAAGALLRALKVSGMIGEGLRLHALAPDNPLRLTLASAARLEGLAVTASLHPPRVPSASDAPAQRFSLQEARNQSELRDGVEILMALEASGATGRAGGATVQDNRESAFLRAMSRNLAREKLCRVSLLMDEARPVAAALTLGRGKRRWLYKAAAEEAGTARETRDRLEGLLALIRQGSPGLELLGLGDRLALPAGAEAAVHDLAFGEASPRRPVDLARRLRAGLDRSLFRLRPGAAGG